MNVTNFQPRLDLRDKPLGQAQLTNMALCLRTMLDCRDADEGSPRLGLFYGFSGYGKTVAAAFTAARTGAAYVEAKHVWTQRSFLEAVAAELGIPRPATTLARIFEQIVDQLNREPRPLIIDETDYLVKKSCANLIRDIHDATRSGILMIGMEELPDLLREWEQFHNRILVATAAQPASDNDARALRDNYCQRVAVADDLVERFRLATGGVTRRIVVNLQAAQRAAMQEGIASIDLAWWGARPIQTGEVAARRRDAA